MSLVLNALDAPLADRARVHCLSDESNPRTLSQLGADSRHAGAWLKHLVGRSGTVAALLTASHDCLATFFGALRSGSPSCPCLIRHDVFIAGRTDDVLIVAGRNIDARALDALVGAHPTCRPGNAACVSNGSGRYVVVLEPRSVAMAQEQLRSGAREIRGSLIRQFAAGRRPLSS